jgi:hypothetical protein
MGAAWFTRRVRGGSIFLRSWLRSVAALACPELVEGSKAWKAGSAAKACGSPWIGPPAWRKHERTKPRVLTPGDSEKSESLRNSDCASLCLGVRRHVCALDGVTCRPEYVQADAVTCHRDQKRRRAAALQKSTGSIRSPTVIDVAPISRPFVNWWYPISKQALKTEVWSIGKIRSRGRDNVRTLEACAPSTAHACP